MDLLSLVLVLVVGILISRRISKRIKTQQDELLAHISEKTERLKRFESELVAETRHQEWESLGLHTKRCIGLENLVLLDRSVVYTKRSVETYYDENSGHVFAFSSNPIMLVSSKFEIEPQDLRSFLLSESKRTQKVMEEPEIEGYQKIIPIHHSA